MFRKLIIIITSFVISLSFCMSVRAKPDKYETQDTRQQINMFIRLEVGESEQLGYTPDYSIKTGDVVNWQIVSMTNNCVSLSEDGTVTAENPGDAVINADVLNGPILHYEIHVFTGPDNINFYYEDYYVRPELSFNIWDYLSASPYTYQRNYPLSISSSSDVIEVDGTKLIPRKKGSSVISVKTDNGLSASAVFNVGNYADYIDAEERQFMMSPDDTLQLDYILSSMSGVNDFSDEEVVWTYDCVDLDSEGTPFARISQDGRITSQNLQGEAYAYAFIKNRNYVGYNLWITGIADGLWFSPENPVIPVGETVSIHDFLINEFPGVFPRGFVLVSSNPEVISTEGETLHAHKEGTCLITVKDALTVLKTCLVSVGEKGFRISGSGRFQTSMKIADAYKDEKGIEKFDNIILSSGLNFADALAGSYLSYKKDAPILITAKEFGDIKPYEEVNAYIKSNLKEGGTVYVLGGTGAVPEEALTGLEGITFIRLKGAGRFETNIEILKEAGVKDEEILVATGFNFADSLSASAVNRPILLVGDELNEDQLAYLDKLETDQFYILGGTGAITERVEEQLKEIGKAERIKGKGRHETSVAIAEKFCNNADRAVLAYSMNFPDGLCAGPLASAMNAPLILTTKLDYDAAKKFCSDRTISDGYVIGGVSLIRDDAVSRVFNIR